MGNVLDLYTVNLPTASGNIRVRLSDQGTCVCDLIVGNRTLEIGGYTVEYVATHFLEMLAERDSLRNDGFIGNIPVAWIMVLSSPHTTIYAGRKAGLLTLFFQNAANKIFAELQLTESDCCDWSQRLATLKV